MPIPQRIASGIGELRFKQVFNYYSTPPQLPTRVGVIPGLGGRIQNLAKGGESTMGRGFMNRREFFPLFAVKIYLWYASSPIRTDYSARPLRFSSPLSTTQPRLDTPIMPHELVCPYDE